jgi:hypothetical protein
VTLAGLPLGKGTWVIDIAEDQFTAAASGATSGLLQIFASGTGSGASRGSIVSGKPTPASYASNVTTDRKTEEIRMTIIGGNVKDYAVTPPMVFTPDRIPVTEAHRMNVYDPMTASLIRVSGNGDPMRPEACARVISVFDGRMRFDLKLSFKRMEMVRAERGYEGPAVVCAVQFTPISGYVASRPAIKYLIAQRDIEAWLVPVASTKVVVPFRVAIPTPLGLGVLRPRSVRHAHKAAPCASGSKRNNLAVRLAARILNNIHRGGTVAVAEWRLTLGDTRARINEDAKSRQWSQETHHVGSGEGGATYRRERSSFSPESAIRARFVPDSFLTVNLTPIRRRM